MELLLEREPSDEQRTFGSLAVDGQFLCHTLEDVVRESKIHGRTAIPAGRYRITLEYSPRFGADTITVNDVPGFSGVRVHAGNTESDTEGCPLVGKVRAERSILRSREALAELKPIVSNAIGGGDEVWLTVRDW